LAFTPAATTPPSRAWSGFGRGQINLRFSGTPHDRTRLLLGRKLPAVNVFGAQFYIMEQLGFRKIVDTTFMMSFLLSANADQHDTERYFRALRRAQQEIDLEPGPYKHYYARELPADLLELVDVRRFGPGERIVFEPYTKSGRRICRSSVRPSRSMSSTTAPGVACATQVRDSEHSSPTRMEWRAGRFT
jgi:hypothetical protein